jgi:hypothetical protein
MLPNKQKLKEDIREGGGDCFRLLGRRGTALLMGEGHFLGGIGRIRALELGSNIDQQNEMKLMKF